ALDIYRAVDAFDPGENYSAEEDTDGLFCVRFADDAQEFFYRWLTDLETAKLRAAERPVVESHLAKYRSLMPSLALLFHLTEILDPQGPGGRREVSLAAARLAAGWCDFLEAHARRIYQNAVDGDSQPAQALAERLNVFGPGPFTARAVLLKGWSG